MKRSCQRAWSLALPSWFKMNWNQKLPVVCRKLGPQVFGIKKKRRKSEEKNEKERGKNHNLQSMKDIVHNITLAKNWHKILLFEDCIAVCLHLWRAERWTIANWPRT